ncbi:MAG: cytochrome c [Elusimicrobia bacterium]|nr:cytochrome c [Elusimicrobiota bacterium]
MVIAVAIGGCAKMETPERLGQAHFITFTCNRCHRVGSSGGTDAVDLTFVGFRHNREWLDLWLKDPAAWKKDTTMQNFHLQEKTRRELTAYLASLKGQNFDKVGRPWNDSRIMSDFLERGRIIYEKAGCIACHGKASQGGYPNNNVPGGKIPPLEAVADGYTKEELAGFIKKGRKPDKADPNGPEPLIEMPAWGQVLNDAEVALLVDYLYSLRPKGRQEDAW